MKLIILDRDGVINQESNAYIKSPDEWIAIPNSLNAIANLTQAGFAISIATNQSGIGRGLYTEATLKKIHDKLHKKVKQHGGKVDKIFYCPHHPDENCHCRKPKSGLIEQIGKFYQADLNQTPIIGDSLRDLEAGTKLGCQPILVETGNGKNFSSAVKETFANVLVFADLFAAADYLISH